MPVEMIARSSGRNLHICRSDLWRLAIQICLFSVILWPLIYSVRFVCGGNDCGTKQQFRPRRRLCRPVLRRCKQVWKENSKLDYAFDFNFRRRQQVNDIRVSCCRRGFLAVFIWRKQPGIAQLREIEKAKGCLESIGTGSSSGGKLVSSFSRPCRKCSSDGQLIISKQARITGVKSRREIVEPRTPHRVGRRNRCRTQC